MTFTVIVGACSIAPSAPTPIGTSKGIEGVPYTGAPQTIRADGFYSIGSPSAPVVIDDYSDYLCPTCALYVAQTEPDLIAKYVATGKVRLNFYPVLNFGERSVRTAEAAICAAKQGLGWQMHDVLYANQSEIWNTGMADVPGLIKGYAATLSGLDAAKFNACFDNRDAQKSVVDADAEQRTRGITYQPIFEVNGQRFSGAQPLSVFENFINDALTPTPQK